MEFFLVIKLCKSDKGENCSFKKIQKYTADLNVSINSANVRKFSDFPNIPDKTIHVI